MSPYRRASERLSSVEVWEEILSSLRRFCWLVVGFAALVSFLRIVWGVCALDGTDDKRRAVEWAEARAWQYGYEWASLKGDHPVLGAIDGCGFWEAAYDIRWTAGSDGKGARRSEEVLVCCGHSFGSCRVAGRRGP